MSGLRVEGLVVAYGRTVAVKGIDLVVEPGQVVTLVGANGAGKTTVMRALSGLLRPRAGRVVFDGADIAAGTPLIRLYDCDRAFLTIPSGTRLKASQAVEVRLPGLPTLPPARMADSGYMSSNFLNSLENDEDRSPDPQDYEMAAQYRARGRRSHTVVKTERSASSRPLPPMYPSDALNSDMNIEMEIPGDMNQLPHKMLLNLPPGRREQSQGYVSTDNDELFRELFGEEIAHSIE